MARPLVLLSNDDGHFSRGLLALREALAPTCDVVTVAPATEQSASSHSLSLHRPLRMLEVGPGAFSVDGTPADCVYVALNSGTRVLPRRPDVVVSGLNHGLNLGQDVFYSGTVAAAREAALRGVPSIAASAHAKADFGAAAALAARIALSIAGKGAMLLNLNVLQVWNGGVRVTRFGIRHYEDFVEFRRDPRGREYLWIGGSGVTHTEDDGSDTNAYDAGLASITPLVLDLTAHTADIAAIARNAAAKNE